MVKRTWLRGHACVRVSVCRCKNQLILIDVKFNQHLGLPCKAKAE